MKKRQVYQAQIRLEHLLVTFKNSKVAKILVILKNNKKKKELWEWGDQRLVGSLRLTVALADSI